jgi:hypothetical protein
VSELLISIYASMEENASDLKSIGIDVTPQGVAKGLSSYPEVQNAVLDAGTFQNLDLTGVKWGVTDKNSFAKAVSASLSPFNALLYTLLCSGRFNVMDFTKIDGGDGYQNAIVPMLNALGCEVALTQEEFKAQAREDKNSMIYNSAEKQNYDYNTNSCINGGQCLHYTQVVWSNSVHLGCARVQCTNGWWFVTCNYDSPGNVVGQTPY